MMVVVGLSHHTAPIEVRERAALSSDAVGEILCHLREQREVGEAFIVSTCNRVEIVAAPRDVVDSPLLLEQTARSVEAALVQRAPAVREHLYRRMGAEAVRHLFRVASSLDSLVLGEPQILGQVKFAFDVARKQGTIGGQLHRAVTHAIRAAKRVRTETTVGAGQVSVPSVSVDLARQIFGELRNHKAALIGSGQMGEAAAKLLVGEGAKLQVVGRNQDRVGFLAAQLGATGTSFDRLPDVLSEADVVVTTTSAAHYVVTYEAVKAARKKRRGRSLFLIDLAVPRDVDPRINELDGVFLYNVDDLSQIVAQTMSSRQKEASRAEQIVEEEARTFERGMHAQQVTPVVVALRRRVENTLQSELDRTLRSRLKHLNDDDREALHRMMEAAVNKILHAPTRHLRTLATEEERAFELEAGVALVADMFELDKESATLSASRTSNAVPHKDDAATDPDTSSVVPRITQHVG
jgi:glutamyl-tRNA reductase